MLTSQLRDGSDMQIPTTLREPEKYKLLTRKDALNVGLYIAAVICYMVEKRFHALPFLLLFAGSIYQRIKRKRRFSCCLRASSRVPKSNRGIKTNGHGPIQFLFSYHTCSEAGPRMAEYLKTNLTTVVLLICSSCRQHGPALLLDNKRNNRAMSKSFPIFIFLG